MRRCAATLAPCILTPSCGTRPASLTSPPAPSSSPSSRPPSPTRTATWQALLGGTKKLDEEGLLEKVAKSLRDRPLRPGRSAPVTPDLGAFLLLADLAAGTASDAAGRVMETDAGKARARAGLVAAGQLLARELTR